VDSSTGGGMKKGGPPARGTAPKGAARPSQAGPAGAGAQEVVARVVDDASGEPVSGALYEVVSPDGTVVASGKTDWQGVVRQRVEGPGGYEVRVRRAEE